MFRNLFSGNRIYTVFDLAFGNSTSGLIRTVEPPGESLGSNPPLKSH